MHQGAPDTGGGQAVEQAGEARSSRIESLRALAALGVLAGHVLGRSLGDGAPAMATLPRRVVYGGGFGVDVFFALSGYLLFRPFAQRDLGGGAAVDLRRYAVNRVLRIVPLYYVAVVLLMVVERHGGSASPWLHYLTFSESTLPDGGSIDGPMWSLCVEALYYALLPAVALLLARAARGSAVRASGALLLAGGVLLAVHRLTVVDADPSPAWRYSLPANAVFFVPGMLLAVLTSTALGPALVGRLRGVAASSSAWLVAAAACWLVVADRYSRVEAVLLACFLTVGACVLPLREGAAVRALSWRPLALLGVCSYSLYIWHFPIVQSLPVAAPALQRFPVLLAVAVPVCVVVAVTSYALVERPFLRLRRRWAASPRSVVPDGEVASQPGGQVAVVGVEMVEQLTP